MRKKALATTYPTRAVVDVCFDTSSLYDTLWLECGHIKYWSSRGKGSGNGSGSDTDGKKGCPPDKTVCTKCSPETVEWVKP